MSRITASIFKERLANEEERFEKRIDEWLEKVALPNFKGQHSGYLINDELFKSKFRLFTESLERRGFIVNTYSSNAEVYVYLSLPSME